MAKESGQHQRLWAPWRLGYVSGTRQPEAAAKVALLPDADEACFLCRAAATVPDQSEFDRQSLVVTRGEHDLVILNRYPYGNGHLLVAPRSHRAGLDQLGEQAMQAIWQSITRFTGLLKQVVQAEGFNIGLNLGRAAGAGVPGHLHWHIVPRWEGDHNFMPTLAGIRVIPQSLDALWEALVAASRAP